MSLLVSLSLFPTLLVLFLFPTLVSSGLGVCSGCALGCCAGGKYGAGCGNSCNPGQSCTDCCSGGGNGCTNCNPGTSCSGGTGPVACSQGFYQDLPGQSSCQPCPKGRYRDTSGGQLCQVCPKGTYQDQPQSTTCKKCPPGFYGNTTELTTSTCSGRCLNGADCDSVSGPGPNLALPFAGAVVPVGTFSPFSSPTRTVAPTLSTTVSSSLSTTTTPTFSISPSPVSCQVGYYCDFDRVVGFVKALCPAGRYGATTLLRDAGCSGPCPSGYFCPIGTFNFSYFPCPPGTVCPTGSTTPITCPAGVWCGGRSGNALEGDGPCTSGYYCRGDKNCTLPPMNCSYNTRDPYALNNSWCPPDTLSIPLCPPSGLLGSKSSREDACPPGTLQPYPGAPSSASCAPCPAGTFESSSAWAFPVCGGSCPPGSYGRVEGATNFSSGCNKCLPGRYSFVAASSVCAPCGLGTYAPSNGTSDCTLCAKGYYGSTIGSNTSLSCQPCPVGTWNDAEGQGLAGCRACDYGFYGVPLKGGVGAVSAAQGCSPCPPGKYTAQAGSSDASQCLVLPVPCDAFTEPQAPPFAISKMDCIPVLCPPPLLNLTAAQEGGGGASPTYGCEGCPPSTFGVKVGGGCRPCPDRSPTLCPGLLSIPLWDPQLAANYTPSCPYGEGIRSPLFPPSEVDGSFSVLGGWVVYVGSGSGLAFTIFLVSLPFVTRWLYEAAAVRAAQAAAARAASNASKRAILMGASPPPAAAAAAATAEALTSEGTGGLTSLPKKIDMFSMDHKCTTTPGEDVPRFFPTVFGGVCTMIAWDFILLLSLFFIISFFSFSNVATNRTLDYVDASTTLALLSKYPWLRTPLGGSLPPFQGLWLRVLAHGEPGKCASPLPLPTTPTSSSSTPTSPSSISAPFKYMGPISGTSGLTVGSSGWVLRAPLNSSGSPSTPLPPSLSALFPPIPGTCGGSGLNELNFFCDSCDFTGTTLTLTFNLHYSCQALVVDVLAAGPALPAALSLTLPTATLYRYTPPFNLTSGSPKAGSLASLAITVDALLGLVVDERSGWGGGGGTKGVQDVSGRGFIIRGGSTTATFKNTSALLAPGAGTYFTPALSSVAITVTFTLDTMYSILTAQLRQTPSGLFVSLASLVGGLAVFRTLFTYTESLCCKARPPPTLALRHIGVGVSYTTGKDVSIRRRGGGGGGGGGRGEGSEEEGEEERDKGVTATPPPLILGFREELFDVTAAHDDALHPTFPAHFDNSNVSVRQAPLSEGASSPTTTAAAAAAALAAKSVTTPKSPVSPTPPPVVVEGEGGGGGGGVSIPRAGFVPTQVNPHLHQRPPTSKPNTYSPFDPLPSNSLVFREDPITFQSNPIYRGDGR